MLADLLKSGYGKSMNLNCAEKMLYGANWAYNLKLPPDALRLASGFGGGMGIGETCGVVTGAVMVLSAMYVKRNAKEGERIKILEEEFIATFRKEMGCIDCNSLKKQYRDEVTQCDVIIFKGAKILDSIIAREGY